jgi:hypothetical protein
LQFLFDGCAHVECGAHRAASAAYTFADRLERREEFEASAGEAGANPALALFLAAERPRRAAEGKEPLGNP